MGLLSDASPFRVEQHQRSEAVGIDSLKDPTIPSVVRNANAMHGKQKEKWLRLTELVNEDALLDDFVW